MFLSLALFHRRLDYILKNLINLTLTANNLTGKLPIQMSNLTHLKFINLSSNNFAEEFPGGYLRSLQLLNLASSNLIGDISTSLAISSLFVNLSTCFNPKLLNASLINAPGFSPALATWYGDPTGAGSGSPIQVTITDECPGLCNAVPYHFDLSGTAFGKLAKPGLADSLRKLGQVDIVYRRVPCYYPGTKIAFLVDPHSNPNYFAIAIEYENGDGDLGWVELGVGKNWLPMQQAWGAMWKVDITPQMKGPFSIKLTTIESKKTVVAYQVIPANWVAGKKYWSNVNL
ncbi:hypothetical protein LguiA_003891 [Lonicera macranthoides]